MFRPAVALAFLLTAWSAFAYEEARLSPDRLALRVGHAADVQVSVYHVSGWNYTMWQFAFTTDRPDVIGLDGTLDYEYPKWSGTFHVRALATGTAKILSGGKVYATVEVTCGLVEPVRPVAAVVTAKSGETVNLAVTTGNEAVRVLHWYAGRLGDTTRPLAGHSTEIAFKPAGTGSHYVWVSAHSPCASSSTEFRVDVLGTRNRAVRK